MAAIGRTVSEIAHDMKSPLTAVGGSTTQVKRKLSPDDVNRKKLDMVVNETSRLESVVKEMPDFGRPLGLETGMESINYLAGECAALSLPIAEKHEVEIRTEFDPDLPHLDFAFC